MTIDRIHVIFNLYAFFSNLSLMIFAIIFDDIKVRVALTVMPSILAILLTIMHISKTDPSNGAISILRIAIEYFVLLLSILTNDNHAARGILIFVLAVMNTTYMILANYHVYGLPCFWPFDSSLIMAGYARADCDDDKNDDQSSLSSDKDDTVDNE